MKDTWCMVMSPSKKSDCFLVLCISSAELGRALCKCVPWRYCIETEKPPAPNFAEYVHVVHWKPMPCRDTLAGSEWIKQVCTEMTCHLLHLCKEKHEKKLTEHSLKALLKNVWFLWPVLWTTGWATWNYESLLVLCWFIHTHTHTQSDMVKISYTKTS